MRAALSVLVVSMLLAGLTAAPGCSRSTSKGGGEGWSFNTPPAAANVNGPSARDRSGQRVVVLGHFRTPANPLGWTGVGPGMSDALARTLLNHGDFDVWINPNLARRVESLIDTTPEDRAAQVAAIRKAFPAVQLVVTGRVTDFQHTTDLMPNEPGKSGFNLAPEAVVAIQLNVFDLDLGRVVASDHVFGAARAPSAPSAELYRGVAFDSYIFWSTPLGLASEEAVRQAMAVLNRTVPTRDWSIRIVRREDERRVRIAAGPISTLDRDRKLYVCTYNEATDTLDPVLDPDSGMPIRARIEASSRIASTAWLLGRTPPGTDLRGAVLCTSPTASIASLAVDRARQSGMSSEITADGASGGDRRRP